MRNDKENIIVKLSFDFALAIIEFTEILNDKNKFMIGGQILKSGTSIGANITEAQNAESKLDFIHKMKIAAKEIDETKFWLDLCKYSNHYPYNKNLSDKLMDINKIVSKIISTTKNNLNKNGRK